MSKSDDNVNAFVTMTDDKDTVIRKFKRAVTDSGSEIRFAEENRAFQIFLPFIPSFRERASKRRKRSFRAKATVISNSRWAKPLRTRSRPYRKSAPNFWRIRRISNPS